MISQQVAFLTGILATFLFLSLYTYAWYGWRRWRENRKLRHIRDTYDRELERHHRLGEMFYGLL